MRSFPVLASQSVTLREPIEATCFPSGLNVTSHGPFHGPFLESLSAAVAAHPLLTDMIPRSTALRQQLDTPLAVAVLGY